MRLLVVVPSGENYQRFIASGALGELERSHDVFYVLPTGRKKHSFQFPTPEIPDSKRIYVDLSDHEHRRRSWWWKMVFDSTCFFAEGRSPSFKIRNDDKRRKLRSLLVGEPRPLRSTDIWRAARRIVSWNLQPGEGRKYFLESLGLAVPQILAVLPGARFVPAFIGWVLGSNPRFVQLFRMYQPDLVLLTNSMTNVMGLDLTYTAGKQGVPLWMLVTGWDNLSSKGITPFEFDLTIVWGEQTRRHAIEVQRQRPGTVVALGAPHYEVLWDRRRSLQRPFRTKGVPAAEATTQKRRLLLGGAFRQFDEISVLKRIDAWIEDGLLPPMEVVFRPHPWRVARHDEESFWELPLRHVRLDPAMENVYRNARETGCDPVPEQFQFDMQYLAGLLAGCDVVVCPMSTLVLEAAILGKPVVAIAFNDGKHWWSADKTAQMKHFDEVRGLGGVLFCASAEDLRSRISDAIVLAEARRTGAAEFDELSDLVHFEPSRPYSQRLLDLVSERARARTPAAPGFSVGIVDPGVQPSGSGTSGERAVLT